MRRLSKDEYFLRIAAVTAQRSTCLDKQVGCVLVDKHGIILSTGYNGAPRGMQHCTVCRVDTACDKNACVAAHAEQNALLHARPNDIYACYSTLEPCIVCTRMLMNTSCERIVYDRATNPAYSGAKLWRELNDSTTWQHGPFI